MKVSGRLPTSKPPRNTAKNLKKSFSLNKPESSSGPSKVISKSDLLFEELINAQKVVPDNHDAKCSTKVSSSKQIKSKVSLKSFFGRQQNSDEDLDSANLQEKGTMTEPILSKGNNKSTSIKPSVNKAVSTDYVNLESILKIVTENKADSSKVPLVVLSKSSSLSKTSDCDTRNLDIDLPHDICNSKQKSSVSSDDLDSTANTNSLTNLSVIKSNSESHSPPNEELSPIPLSEPLAFKDIDHILDDDRHSISSLSPNFKGFASPTHTAVPPLRFLDIDDQFTPQKRLHFFKDKSDPLSPENTSLDHSYSHGNTVQEDAASPLSKSSTSDGNKHKRSLYTSPIASPPDIMLHNDKINILRQMSKIFNNEKTNKPKQDKENKEQISNNDLYLNEIINQTNKVNWGSKKKLNESVSTKNEPVDKLSKDFVDDTSSSDSSLSSKMTQVGESKKKVSLSSSSASTNLKNDGQNQKSITLKRKKHDKELENTSENNLAQNSSDSSKKSLKSYTLNKKAPESDTTESSKENIKINLNKSDDTDLKTSNADQKDDKSNNKEVDLPIKGKEDSSPTISFRHNSKNTRFCKKVKKKFKKKIKGQGKEISPENTDSALHLIAELPIKKRKSIKVKSYIGEKDEHVDIIDGFTFLSFPSNTEMESYSSLPAPKRTKSRKAKKSSLDQDFVEYFEDESWPDLSRTPSDDIDSQNQEDAGEEIDNRPGTSPTNEDSFESHTEEKDLVLSPTKEATGVAEKIVESSNKEELTSSSAAFASEDLDTFLDQNAQLKISFEIPSCTATEEGVTKYDDDGNAIVTEKKKPYSLQKNIPTVATSPNDDKATFKVPNKPVSSLSTFLKKRKPNFSQNHPVKSVNIVSKPDNQIEKKTKTDLLTPKRIAPLVPTNDFLRKKSPHSSKVRKESYVEIVYVYSRGRLLKLAGSLTKINPSNSNSVRARVALPNGYQKFSRHAMKRQVQTVEINEDMAKFALSALISPTQKFFGNSEVNLSNENECEVLSEKKASESNILPSKSKMADILADKLALNKMDNVPEEEQAQKLKEEENLLNEESKNSQDPKDLALSKIRWTQNDVLRKSSLMIKTQSSTAFTKNFKRFPSLSREMKRLNMNFVTYEQPPPVEEEEEDSRNLQKVCKLAHCKLGCICDSLKCKQKAPDHCGRMECMFNCSCEQESWKFNAIAGADVPKTVSIFHLDKEYQETLAVKEKDFKKTIVQSGGDLYILGGERKKRDIKAPERFRDNTYFSLFNSGPSSPPIETKECNAETCGEAPSICPEEYRKHIKPFSIDIPWYTIKGISIWCMIHSCYDCQCLTDKEFYGSSIENIQIQPHESPITSSVSSPVILPSVESVFIPGLYTKTSTASKIPVKPDFFVLPSKTKCHIDQITADVGSKESIKWSVKYWTHNSLSSCARTAGYTLKGISYRDIFVARSANYQRAYPKPPYIVGQTVWRSHTTKRPLQDSTEEQGKLESSVDKNLEKEPNSNDIQSAERSELPSTQSAPTQVQNPKPNSKTKEDVTAPAPKKAKLNENPFVLKDVIQKPANNKKQSLQDTVLITPGETLTQSLENIVAATENQQKILSFNEMIEEEEKRGELELDLTNKIAGRSILVAEVRFRKLFNMCIIGIIGLNKVGRCIVDTVKSSEDLFKMQRIQRLINDYTIDVGPMRELFYPTSVDHSKVKYVMIRCDNQGRWEIIGVVQRKDHPSSINQKSKKKVSPKPKVPSKDNQLTEFSETLQLSSKIKDLSENPTKSSLHNYSKSEKKCSLVAKDLNMPISSEIERDNANISEVNSSNSEVLVLAEKPPTETTYVNNSTETVNQPMFDDTSSQDLVLENNYTGNELPLIASVHGASDPCTKDVIGSPPRVPQTEKAISEPWPKKFKFANSSIGTLNSTDFLGHNPNSSQIKIQANSMLRPINPGLEKLSSPRFIKLNAPNSDKKPVSFQIGSPCPPSSSTNITHSNSSTSYMSQATLVYSLNTASRMIFTSPSKGTLTTSLRDTLPIISPKPTDNQNSQLSSSHILLYSPPKSAALTSSNSTGPVPEFKKKMMLYVPPSVKSVCIPGKGLYTKKNPKTTTKDSINQKNTVNILRPQSLVQNPCQPTDVATFESFSSVKPIFVTTSHSSANPIQNSVSNTCNAQSQLQITVPEIVNNSNNAPNENFKDSLATLNSVAIPHEVPLQSNSSCGSQSDASPLSSQEKNLEDNNSSDSDIEEITNREDISILPEKFTAIDLSLHFKSAKIPWLSGTVKKQVLDNIYKMSKEGNVPIYLCVKNGSNDCEVYAMHCHQRSKDSPTYPVLALASNAELVDVLSKMNERTLFRSNITKYFFKAKSGQLNSFTYDAKGTNLVWLPLRQNSGKIGSKYPVGQLRMKEYRNDSIQADRSNQLDEITPQISITPISHCSDHDSQTVSEPNPVRDIGLKTKNENSCSEPPLGNMSDDNIVSQALDILDKYKSSQIDENVNKSITEKETAQILSENSEIDGKKSKSFGIACFSGTPNPSYVSPKSPPFLRKSGIISQKEGPVKTTFRMKSPKRSSFSHKIPILTKREVSLVKDTAKPNISEPLPVQTEEHDDIDILTPYEPPSHLFIPETPSESTTKKGVKKKPSEEASISPNLKLKAASISSNSSNSSSASLLSLVEDPCERHNLTERLRRKGQAYMFKHLDNVLFLKQVKSKKLSLTCPKKSILDQAVTYISTLKLEEADLFAKEKKEKRRRKDFLKRFAAFSTTMGATEVLYLSDWVKKNVTACSKKRKDFEESDWKPSRPEIDDPQILISPDGNLSINGLSENPLPNLVNKKQAKSSKKLNTKPKKQMEIHSLKNLPLNPSTTSSSSSSSSACSSLTTSPSPSPSLAFKESSEPPFVSDESDLLIVDDEASQEGVEKSRLCPLDDAEPST